jgi:hypothetical protein
MKCNSRASRVSVYPIVLFAVLRLLDLPGTWEGAS